MVIFYSLISIISFNLCVAMVTQPFSSLSFVTFQYKCVTMVTCYCHVTMVTFLSFVTMAIFYGDISLCCFYGKVSLLCCCANLCTVRSLW